MSYLPYRPEHVNDAIANSEELTNEELGAFVRITWALWRAGGYLPDDHKKLARFARAGSRWGSIAPAVMAKLTIAAGKISCPEILMTIFLVEQRRARAAKAAAARHGKPDPGLSSRNPLDSLKSNITVASTEHVLAASNQNQSKNLESKSFNAPRLATGPQANQAFYELSVEFLIKRVGVRSLAARSQVAKWLAAVDGNEADLQAIMDGAGRENLNGARLIAVIDQRVGSRQAERKRGPPLPFPPNLVVNDGK
ncbi:MAG TPA: DUF1376 domain-containing protein [Methylocella sp.]|nr:DUF1376 domain-containing protein [Methylocella sp.]